MELPHLLIESLMVSDITADDEEGWPFVDAMPDPVCQYDYTRDDRPPSPSVLHYCQRYIVGPYFQGKRRVPKDFFTCESPLLVKPPMDLGEAYDYKNNVGLDRTRNGLVKSSLSPKQARRNAFMICTMTKSFNAASEFFKKNHCSGVDLEYTLDLGALQVP